MNRRRPLLGAVALALAASASHAQAQDAPAADARARWQPLLGAAVGFSWLPEPFATACGIGELGERRVAAGFAGTLGARAPAAFDLVGRIAFHRQLSSADCLPLEDGVYLFRYHEGASSSVLRTVELQVGHSLIEGGVRLHLAAGLAAGQPTPYIGAGLTFAAGRRLRVTAAARGDMLRSPYVLDEVEFEDGAAIRRERVGSGARWLGVYGVHAGFEIVF